MIPRPVQGGGEGFVPHSGGAIFNTAIALGRLGVETGFLTGLSTDLFGAQLEADLKQSHVDTRYALRSPLPTTLAFVRLNNGQASYTFYDENTAGRSLTPEQLPHLSEEITALYFGGISLISEPCADFYAALAERMSSERAIVLDPNIRPGFIRDEARYRDRLDRMIGVSDIVKVSDEDLDWIVPGDTVLEEKVKVLFGKGPAIVIVTRGSQGANAFRDQAEEIYVPAKRVAVVDTVGAGDTFNAGVLASLVQTGMLRKDRVSAITSDQLRSALQFGAAVAAVTVSRAGSNPPWAREL